MEIVKSTQRKLAEGKVRLSSFLKRMGLIHCLLFSLGFSALVSFSVAAAPEEGRADTISVAGTYVPDLLDGDKGGPYIKLFDLINANVSEEMKLTVMPFRRAYVNFEKMRFDCLFTGILNEENSLGQGVLAGDFIASQAINHLELKAYSLRSAPIVTNLDELMGKIITGTEGDLQALVDIFGDDARDLKRLPVLNEAEAFRLLEEGKTDVVLSFSINAQLYFKRSGNRDLFHTSSKYNLRRSAEVFVCHNTPRNVLLLQAIDQNMYRIRESHSVDEFFGSQ